MRVLNAAYCVIVLISVFVAAWGTTDTLASLFLVEFTKAHPLAAHIVDGVILTLFFVKGMILSLRHPAAFVIFLFFATIIGTIILIFHFWY